MQKKKNVPTGTGGSEISPVDETSSIADRFAQQPLARRSASLPPFTSEQTHGFVQSHHTSVAVNSDSLGWRSLFVSRQKERPFQTSFGQRPDPLIALALNGPARVWLAFHGIGMEKQVLPGSFGIVPSGLNFEAKLDRPLETIHVYVRRELIGEMAESLYGGDPSRAELVPRFGEFDALVEHLVREICAQAQAPTAASALYVEYLTMALAARLVQDHSTAATHAKVPQAPQRLTSRQMQSARDYIETNLAGLLSLEELARSLNMSPAHFARLFKQSTGLAPYQYVIRSRIERVQRLLAQTNEPISRIAIACGFADQMHLTQTFRRMTGSTPAAFRKQHYR